MSKSKSNGPATNNIAPDLNEDVERLLSFGGSDSTQKVIITLKTDLPQGSENRVDSGILLGDISSPAKLKTKIAGAGGRLKRQFAATGMIAADLPLSRIRDLAQDDAVAYISPDRPIEATAAKNSHYYKTTGALEGSSEISGLNADGSGIGVAVLDSGIDTAHKLLKPSPSHPGVVYSKSFTGRSATIDEFGHGTHVASLLAGDPKFKGKVYGGIAPGVHIINLAVLDDLGKGLTSSAIEAVEWVIANKAAYNIRVINMSLGTPARDSYINDPLCITVRRAFAAGIVVVAAAGNYGKNELETKVYGSINSPGIEPSVITVGAANSFGSDYRTDDIVTTFSSRGPTRGYRVAGGEKVYDNLIKPDLVAPGNKLISALSDNSYGKLSSISGKNPSLIIGGNSKKDERLMYMSGTSMATPLVAGAAAMLMQANPNLTPNLVKAILMFTAQQLNGYNSFEQGTGLLNIDGAMEVTKYVKPNVATLTAGSLMLTGPLPFYRNTIAGGTYYWSQGIVTNYGLLYGPDLMKYYQGMYSHGVLMSDSTPFINGQLTMSNSMTTSGLNIYQGSLISNGVLISDGIPFIHSNSLGNGITLGQGVLISDGTLIGDGVLVSDNVASLSVLGDPTSSMQPE